MQREWRAQYQEALACERTAASWQEWSEDRVTQAAAAWILTTVFIRFIEDNELVKPVWIAGPKHRRPEALHAQAEFLRTQARVNPDVTDREWLLDAIGYLAKRPAVRDLVDDTSALWLVTPSGDAAARLLAFWRERDEAGEPLRDLTDKENLDTRFLGDLYQELSQQAQEKYALKQTPVFVEEFILDHTLDKALKELPLEGFTLIDPTCGSGHFLLGAFTRLIERWRIHRTQENPRERVQLALDAIHGVDLNPFAVAIARFRLTIAAMRESGDASLDDAPAFRFHLAVGDSLLHGQDQLELDMGTQFSADRTAAGYAYPTENLAALRKILENGRYHVVVGNPPYITVKDKALNKLYRARYGYCKGTYALTVPFMERFFELAKGGERPGWVGQITSNSFMKREFGAPLIEKFLPTKDLTLVADTSGAYIPGHGTPTVIIVGRNRRPVASTVRAVLGVRGEPGRPEDPAKGLVWSSIVAHVAEPGHNDEWITVSDLDRAILSTHPWSLTGGGAIDLSQAIESISKRSLADLGVEIGRTTHTGADDAFYLPASAMRTLGITQTVPVVLGEDVRDYLLAAPTWTAFPYDETGNPVEPLAPLRWLFWLNRARLASRVDYQQTLAERGLRWFDHSMFFAKRYRRPLSIAFAFVATHNHFVLDRGGKVFNRSAPVVKLPAGATEDDHLALLGVLNSSTACFWLKQNSHDKGIRGEGGGFTPSDWERFYEFTGTTLQDFPLPKELPVGRGRVLDALAQRLGELTPGARTAGRTPDRKMLDEARAAAGAVRAEMIARQEELDWAVYRLYGLIDEDLTYPDGADPTGTGDPHPGGAPQTDGTGDDLPGLALGERAFEIVLARRVAAGTEQTAWFARHGATPITELPAHWPAGYRELVRRRVELIESHPYLRLLERPEHKRRWAGEAWEKQEERALRGWLLDRLEDRRFWFDRHGVPTPRSVAQLADEVARDPELSGVLALWEGRPDVPVAASLGQLLAGEAVPYLAALRYKDSGLRKRAAWEHTWALQRREDAGEKFGTGPDNPPIPVPTKYAATDFAHNDYWRHRGKLDVPKERFILYPDAGRDTDPSPVLGWAGWDHAQQAFALEQLLRWREGEGASDEKLIPLVAGLAELLPWVTQWHSEPDAFYGGASAADFFREQLDLRARQVERTRDQLADWRPTPARRGRVRKATA